MLDELNLSLFLGLVAANPVAMMQMLPPQRVVIGTYTVIVISDSFFMVVAGHSVEVCPYMGEK
jgi:hypothetical protein